MLACLLGCKLTFWDGFAFKNILPCQLCFVPGVFFLIVALKNEGEKLVGNALGFALFLEIEKGRESL